jgi:RHS repeat-associated protein
MRSDPSHAVGGVTTSFVYDYEGRRVKKVWGGVPTVYIGKLYECTNGACTKYIFGGITRIDLKAPAEPKDLLSFGGVGSEAGKQEVPFGAVGTGFIADIYARQTIENEQRVALKASTPVCGSDILYYHTDHLGSSNVMTKTNGDPAEGLYYYPFGATRQVTGGDCVNHKFTGQEEDSETGLYYYGARYYDPALGRFISADSIVPDYTNPQSLNRYSYVLNNPLRYTDPTGHGENDDLGPGTTTGWTNYDDGQGNVSGSFLDQWASEFYSRLDTQGITAWSFYSTPGYTQIAQNFQMYYEMPPFSKMICVFLAEYTYKGWAPMSVVGSRGEVGMLAGCGCYWEKTSRTSYECLDPITGRPYSGTLDRTWTTGVGNVVTTPGTVFGISDDCNCFDPNGRLRR